MKTLTESESVLVADLGVYGIWILKHGQELPKDEVLRIMNVYALYRKNRSEGLRLLNLIDYFCQKYHWEPPRNHYDTALKEYQNS